MLKFHSFEELYTKAPPNTVSHYKKKNFLFKISLLFFIVSKISSNSSNAIRNRALLMEGFCIRNISITRTIFLNFKEKRCLIRSVTEFGGKSPNQVTIFQDQVYQGIDI